ncbi:MAG: phosphotransferase family protein [Dehalococcoidia bacterium]
MTAERVPVPDAAAVRAVVDRVFGMTAATTVERVAEGVSTYVFRIERGAETFYLRVLPEAGASFAPEAAVHRLLLDREVRVPAVVHYEHRNEVLGCSVMVTGEIAGCHVGRRAVDGATAAIVREAGRQLAVINSVPVAGFGWVRRDLGDVARVEGEHATNRTFLTEYLDADLALLGAQALPRERVDVIRSIVAERSGWLEGEQGWLAHGDFDATHIFQEDGRYSGIIDFGEIRGADRWYDLGHFRMHDGEILPVTALDWLLEGYGEAVDLLAGAYERICFASLLIAVRALARRMRRDAGAGRRHQALASIPRDIAALSR